MISLDREAQTRPDEPLDDELLSKFHPLANLFPLMDLNGPEFAAFVEDIRVNGQIDLIVMYEGKPLEGRHRWLACERLGQEPCTYEFDEELEGKPLDFVISKNLHRRHLSETQRAMVAATITTMKAGTRTDLPPIGGRSNGQASVSQEEAAKLMNVSERSVQRAKAVKTKGVPELEKAVKAGTVKLGPAAEIAQLPEEQQEQEIAARANGTRPPSVVKPPKGTPEGLVEELRDHLLPSAMAAGKKLLELRKQVEAGKFGNGTTKWGTWLKERSQFPCTPRYAEGLMDMAEGFVPGVCDPVPVDGPVNKKKLRKARSNLNRGKRR